MSQPCFFYINTSILSGSEIVKIGISFNPDKRLVDINNALRHRHRNGHCEPATFVRAFTVRLPNRPRAKRIESLFKANNRNYLLGRFGTEVFDLSLEECVRRIPMPRCQGKSQ